jgi:hypothetical protein
VRVIYEQEREKPKRHHGIKCLTCKRLLGSKRELRSHVGHDVRYLNPDGTPEDA